MSGTRVASVDFLRRGGTPWPGWLLLGLGLAACASVLLWRQQLLRESAERDAARHAQEVSAAHAREAAQRRLAPTPESRRLAKAREWLQWPWLEALRVIESVTEAPVYLLSVTGDPAQSEFRLEAEAATFAQAVEYVQRLAGAGAFAAAKLQSHEQVPDLMSGGSKVRFTVVASWTRR